MTTPFLVSMGFAALFLWAGCATTTKDDGQKPLGEGNETSSVLPAETHSGSKRGKGTQGKPSVSPADHPSENEASPAASGPGITGSTKDEKTSPPGESSSGPESPKDELAESSDVPSDPVQGSPDGSAGDAKSSKANENSPLVKGSKDEPDQASSSRPALIDKGSEPLDPDVEAVSGEPDTLPEKLSVPEAGLSVDSFFKPVSPSKDQTEPDEVPVPGHPAGASPIAGDPSEPVSSNDPIDDGGLSTEFRPSVELPEKAVPNDLDQGKNTSIVLRPSATDDEKDTVTRGIQLLDGPHGAESALTPSSKGRLLGFDRSPGPVDRPGINPGKSVDFSAQGLQADNSAGNEAVSRVVFLDSSGKAVGRDDAGKRIGFSDEKNSPGILRPPSWNDLDGTLLNPENDSRPTYDSLRRLFDAGKKGEAETSPNQLKVRGFTGIEELLKARAAEGIESPSGPGEDAQEGARYQNALQWLRSRGLTENGKNVD